MTGVCRDWCAYDPNPSSARGVSASLRSSIATASIDGVDALLGRDSLTIPEVHGGSPRRQLVAEAAYGFAILGGHLTGAPWAGIGLLESGRDYRVGYRISPARQSGADLQIGIEGVRRENDHGDAQAEHAIGLRLALRW